ncbi:MAG TPA: ribbon-helix-helix protein, CopG family [Tepidiformaceae bacterium]|nr:ribbon-helix-helix protein, CopG family [Tepidiformaceae bacterium]
MSTMNISLPDDLRAYVDEHVADEGYASSSEYIRELIRNDRRKARLKQLLLEGANSPRGPEADDAYFAGLHERIERRAAGQ